jgi:hypothetical protein
MWLDASFWQAQQESFGDGLCHLQALLMVLSFFFWKRELLLPGQRLAGALLDNPVWGVLERLHEPVGAVVLSANPAGFADIASV